ncbi:RsmB/NOP family class I SAM-dependent RNA methyltransferase [Stygiolobus caldivivus]|uniref:Sun family protein n=1 Tax=Stygiolobus caldivivus TaxID=2824673 RepID=A0A8D5U8V1_9CREN|nr:RsmB/NOP family class I SAM-dependent RNA methyltransferase [Stygiolobus caldivivus]BCU71077.1 Sun family protein [Stygiolobus caldivivus]
MEELLYAKAIRLIIEKKTSPEKAFDLAYKSLKIRGDRKALYQKFLEILKKYYYGTYIFPDRGIEEIVRLVNNEEENVPFKLPSWAETRLKKVCGVSSLNELLNKETWIRVNTLKTDIGSVINTLKDKKVMVEKDSFDFLYRVIETKIRISDLEEFKEGKIVIQDKASIYPVIFLDPKPGEKILEIGSAPGMKTSLIQQLTDNRAYVVAVDISERRIKLQQQLMAKLSVENVELINGDGSHIPIREADKVLIDAPCSNSGTIASDPSIFLRLNKSEMLRLSRLQNKILKEAMRLKKTTVFSTCSLFPEEGERLAEKYEKYLVPIRLNKTNFGYKRSRVWMRVVRFYPNIHHTEGFFISKFNFSL